MKTFWLGFARILTALAFLASLVVAILLFVRGPFLAGISMLVLAILFGVFVYYDVRRLLASRTTTPTA
jgi:hypothetical protein